MEVAPCLHRHQRQPDYADSEVHLQQSGVAGSVTAIDGIVTRHNYTQGDKRRSRQRAFCIGCDACPRPACRSDRRLRRQQPPESEDKL
ncbi:MAG: hypothetical protein R2873_34540 [Caldilineaceae bacterium]